MDDKDRALNVIWETLANAQLRKKKLTKDEEMAIMGWCAFGLGVDVFDAQSVAAHKARMQEGDELA